MSRLAVLLAVAAVLGACGRKERATKGEAKQAEEQGLLSATGVVADVKERSLQVRTDDGRTLDFALDDDVAVTLAGGESQPAVITEGAPVRVSYKPKGSAADLVSVDVEPRGAGATAETPASAGNPSDPARSAGSAPGATGAR